MGRQEMRTGTWHPGTLQGRFQDQGRPVSSLCSRGPTQDLTSSFSHPRAGHNTQHRTHHPLAGFPGGSAGKESACNAGDLGSIPGSQRPLWRRAWPPTPVSLPGESQGQRSLAGYGPWGHRESDTADRLTHTHPLSRESCFLFSGQCKPSLPLWGTPRIATSATAGAARRHTEPPTPQQPWVLSIAVSSAG